MNVYKKCPFCAEEILKEASFCKHCRKKVKFFWFRRGLKFFVMTSLIMLVVLNLDLIQKKSRIVKAKFEEIITVTGDFQYSLEKVGEGLNALKEREPFTLPKDFHEQLYGIDE